MAEAIRIRSEILRLESQTLRNTLFKSDGKIWTSLVESNKTYNDLDSVLDIPLFEDLETDNNSDDDLDITFFDDIEKDNELVELDEESNYVELKKKKITKKEPYI